MLSRYTVVVYACIGVCVCVCARICVRMHVCACACVCACIGACMCMHMHRCMRVYACVCVRMCVRACVRVHLQMRVYFVCSISMSLFLIVPQVVCVKHKQVIHIGDIEQITEKQVRQLYTCMCIFCTQYCKHLEYSVSYQLTGQKSNQIFSPVKIPYRTHSMLNTTSILHRTIQ